MSEMRVHNVYLIIADISGYTNFVRIHQASLVHAEQIVTELMEAVIDAAAQPLILNKLEGDAAFLYAPADASPAVGGQLLPLVTEFFAAFKHKQQALIKAGEGGCFCDACCNIGKLKLKAILHYGQAVIKQVRHMEELAGADVILAHRLLKNRLGSQEYLMMTESFFKLSGGLPDQQPTPYTEEFADIGPVNTLVYYQDSLPLAIPETRRLSRLSGFWEGQRLFLRAFWRRLRGQRPRFLHLPD